MSADPIPALKQHAARALVPILDRLSTADAAALIRVECERIPELRRSQLDRFSLERLIRFLVRAGARVELRITPPTSASSARRDQ